METIIETTNKPEEPRERFLVTSRFLLLHGRTVMSLLLGSSDLLSLILAAGMAIGLRAVVGGEVRSEIYLDLAPIAILSLFVYGWRGLYPAIGLNPVEELHRLSVTTSLIFLSLATFTFLTKTPPKYSRAIFVLAWLAALIIVPSMRSLVKEIGARTKIWGESVAVIGTSEHAQRLIESLRDNPKIGFRPVILFTHTKTEDDIDISVPSFSTAEMVKICERGVVKTALVTTSSLNGEGFKQLEICQNIFERVIIVDIYNSTHLLWLSVRNLGEFIGLEVRHNLLDPWAQAFKRAIDLFVASAGLIISFPLLVVIGILIKIDSPGPVLFRQVRVGRNGDRFKILKFRTMYMEADEALEGYLARDPGLKSEWDRFQKLKDDPRITGLGWFLRTFSIDELPQMWNVIKGNMSLVGPRPFFPEQIEIYGKAFAQYIRVRPGITGMWQTFARNRSSFADRAIWDEYYVRNWSVWLDIYILLRTVLVVLRRDGAF
jgi:Undecaprenyl-phosphate galactose phosphotransferase WbaP